MVNGNGALWARLRFYLALGVVIGLTTAGAFTIFETQAAHNQDVQTILDNQRYIIQRLDALYFKRNTGLARPLMPLPERPEPKIITRA